MTLEIETARLTLRLPTSAMQHVRDLTIETGVHALAICRRADGDAIGSWALVVGRCSLDEPALAHLVVRA
jgi:hypothetical protein